MAGLAPAIAWLSGAAPPRRAPPAPARLGLPPPRDVDRPGARPGRDEVQEDEAVEDRRVAAVQHREEAARRMRHPVGEGHLAREHEGHRPGEQPDHQQQPADQFQHRGEPDEAEHRRQPGRRRRREAEQLLRPMLQEDQRGDDPQHRAHARRHDGHVPHRSAPPIEARAGAQAAIRFMGSLLGDAALGATTSRGPPGLHGSRQRKPPDGCRVF